MVSPARPSTVQSDCDRTACPCRNSPTMIGPDTVAVVAVPPTVSASCPPGPGRCRAIGAAERAAGDGRDPAARLTDHQPRVAPRRRRRRSKHAGARRRKRRAHRHRAPPSASRPGFRSRLHRRVGAVDRRPAIRPRRWCRCRSSACRCSQGQRPYLARRSADQCFLERLMRPPEPLPSAATAPIDAVPPPVVARRGVARRCLRLAPARGSRFRPKRPRPSLTGEVL